MHRCLDINCYLQRQIRLANRINTKDNNKFPKKLIRITSIKIKENSFNGTEAMAVFKNCYLCCDYVSWW